MYLLTNTKFVFSWDLSAVITERSGKLKQSPKHPKEFAMYGWLGSASPPNPQPCQSTRHPNRSTPTFHPLTPNNSAQPKKKVWAWISNAESVPYDDAPDDDLIDTAREALNEIIAERRMLHGDETAPRGG